MNKASYEITLKSGVTLEVTPLSFSARKAIGALSQVEIKDPDVTPFVKKVEHAADPNMTYIDEEDPEYKRLWADVKAKRDAFITNRAIRASVRLKDGNEAEVIATYDSYLNQLAEVGVVMSGDSWVDTLMFGLLGFESDHNTVMRAINGSLPLTETEIADAIVKFRAVV